MLCMDEIGVLPVNVKDVFEHTQYQAWYCQCLSKRLET